MIKWSLYLCVLIILPDLIWSQDPLVMTRQGLVRGLRSSNGAYSMFMGIPYATVDLENPFGDALPAPIFENIFEAHDDTAMCPHREEFNNTIVGTLDCLHLHVYVPSTASSTNRLPVMVWIHGGGFETGWAGRYVQGPEYLVRHDVILVALNYRLGPYGFLCLDTPSVPGNTGLKDQRAALRWVNENIAAFGGDKSSITIFGESAGAMSVDLHIISPGSKGLFHRAILQSGSALHDNLMSSSNPLAPVDLARQLQFITEDVDEALQFLKSASTADLIKANEDLGWGAKICVEKSFAGVEQFLGSTPMHLLETVQYEGVPMLIGYNSDEWLVIYLSQVKSDGTYFDRIQNIFSSRLGFTFNFQSPELLEAAARIAKEYYVGGKEINMEVFYEIVNFESDFMMNYPAERSLKYHFETSPHPIYQYVFAYSGEVNFVKRRNNITEGGAVHADDIGFLFKQAYMPDSNNPEDQLMIDRMTAMWTNFAKFGDPTPETSELLPVRWPAVSRNSRDYLWIDSELRVDKSPFHQRMAFWELFYLSFSQYYLFAL